MKSKARFGNLLVEKLRTAKQGSVIEVPANFSLTDLVQPVVSDNAGNTFSCFVPGDPKAQGGVVPLRSNTTGRLIVITKGSRGLSDWRKAMTEAFCYAAKKIQHQTIDEPCSVKIIFLTPRLAKHPKLIQGPFWSHTKPDIDKLVRAVFDSLEKAGVFTNDSRVCKLETIKRYAGITDTPGIYVAVKRLPNHVSQTDLEQRFQITPTKGHTENEEQD